MKYLTPAILLASPKGLPLAGVPTLELAGWIEEAEAAIDAYMGFDERNSLGFATGVRTEAQAWDPGTRRVYPASFPTPVLSVQSFLIVVSKQSGTGAEVEAAVDPTLVIVNNDEQYLESVSLAIALYSLSPIIAQLGMIAPLVRFSYTAGYQVSKTNRPLYADANGTYHSLIPFWDTSQPYSVFRNGALLAPGTDYTLNPTDGSLVPTVQQSALPITASFIHQIPDVVTQACRKALVDEVASAYFAHQLGLAGADMLRTADNQIRRRGTFRDPDAGAAWQALLADLGGVAVVGA